MSPHPSTESPEQEGTGGNPWWRVRERLPTQPVSRGTLPARELATADPATDIGTVAVVDHEGVATTVGDVLERTSTDAYVVLHDGALVTEWYDRTGGPDEVHAVMSITKSLVGAVAGVLAGRDSLDTDRPVVDYVPELAASGYAQCSVRNLLDMRTGVRFREDYTDPEAEFHELADAVAWRPGRGEGRAGGLYGYLPTIGPETAAGGRFTYRSSDSDVLGWVCERAASARMAELLGTLVWGPMGAERDADLVCDAVGTAAHDGGLAATARDVARFGQLLLDGGVVPDAASGSARQVIPGGWLRQAWAVDADLREAFLGSPSEALFPGGWYRNQLWFRPGRYGDVLLCLGIHGQMLHVCRRTRTVCVKLSSWSVPQRPSLLYDTCAAFDETGGALSGLETTRVPGRPAVMSGLTQRSAGSSGGRR